MEYGIYIIPVAAGLIVTLLIVTGVQRFRRDRRRRRAAEAARMAGYPDPPDQRQ